MLEAPQRRDHAIAWRRLGLLGCVTAFATLVACFGIGFHNLTSMHGSAKLGTALTLVSVSLLDCLYWLFFVKVLSTTDRLWIPLFVAATILDTIVFGLVLSTALICGKPGAQCLTHPVLDLQGVRQGAAIISAIPLAWTIIQGCTELCRSCSGKKKQQQATAVQHHEGWY